MLDDLMVVPNSLAADLVAYQRVKPLDPAPPWHMGMVDWRGRRLPLVSFEAACGRDLGERRIKVQFVVMHCLGGGSEYPFYGLRIKGIPRFELVDHSQIVPVVEQNDDPSYVASRVYVNGKSAFIPNLDAFEALVRTGFGLH
jgi:chemotaxis signal transduction protein